MGYPDLCSPLEMDELDSGEREELEKSAACPVSPHESKYQYITAHLAFANHC